MKAPNEANDAFAFTVADDDGEHVTIEVSDDDYRREQAAGIEDEFLLKPGRYRLRRGGFLSRHPELILKETKQG